VKALEGSNRVQEKIPIRDVFGSRFWRILDVYSPFVQMDVANMMGVQPAAVNNWLKREFFPDAINLANLCHILMGIDWYYLLGETNKPFPDGHTLEWYRQNVPQGEQDLIPLVRFITTMVNKPICSVYRYWENYCSDEERGAFILASYFRYGRGIKSKFLYRDGDGIIGNIDSQPGEKLVKCTLAEQMRVDRLTKDESAFLLISSLRSLNGQLLGCIKIESKIPGKESDITDSQLNDIKTLARIYLENSGSYPAAGEWWKKVGNVPRKIANYKSSMPVMDLRNCLESLKYDISNESLEDDTFAMVCYITMVHEASKLLENGEADERDMGDAEEYLEICRSCECDSLRTIAMVVAK